MRRRRARRRRRRNYWKGDRAGHRRAALKGWRRKRRRRKVKGKRRRRRRKNNPGFSYNPRRRRRRRRRARNRGRRRRSRRGRHRAYNRGALTSVRGIQRSVTAGFKPQVLKKALVITGGALGNAWFSGVVSGFLPGMLQTGPGSYVTGLASAGVLGAGVGMVSPRMAGDVFFGGVLEVVTRGVKEYVLPILPGMSGLGDYLTRTNAMEARPLGDYLTRQNAAEARPLGDYYGDEYVADELAS